MTMRPAAMLGREPHRALLRLAGGEALLRRLQAVVDGIADHVGQRLAQPLDHGLVDLGRLAFQ